MNFEKHTRSNQSRLEAWRKEITEMRRKSWPYKRIAEWLMNEKDFQVSSEAVRQFCRVRNIVKSLEDEGTQKQTGRSPHRRLSAQNAVGNKAEIERFFEYDDSRPININR